MSGDDRLDLRYVPLAELRKWDRNPKPHDIGLLIQSFRRYGFLDPMKVDAQLNGGAGGIVEGNGRLEAPDAKDRVRRPLDIVAPGKDGLWVFFNEGQR